METSPPPAFGSDAWVERFAATLQTERQRAHEFLAAQLARLERTETVVEQQIERLERELRGHCNESVRLREERDALTARLAEAETRLQEVEERLVELPVGSDAHDADEDNDRRYQMALDDIRQLRESNDELREQLAKVKSAPAEADGGRQPRQTGALNWENEKKRILAALEAAADEGDEISERDRQEMADVVETTNRIVAERDREIEDLKQRIAEIGDGGATAAKATASQSLLENDAMISEERERLQRLQEEWREKLRQAEVEIALERAKIARQRAEMEQQNRPPAGVDSKSGSQDSRSQADRSAQGRWLARLGLTDADLVPGKHL